MQTAHSSSLAGATHVTLRLDVAPPRSGRELDQPIVFFVEDDITARESLARLMRTEEWQFEVFRSPEEFLGHPRPEVPSCLVLEATRAASAALELQNQLVARNDLPIIFVSGTSDVATAVRAMKAGAFEVLTAPIERSALVDTIRGAIERSRVAIRHDAEMSGLRSCYASLTPREREVMALVVEGKLNKQVGGDLGISEITVKAHRGQVMRKMKAGSLPDLVRMTSRLGVRTVGTVTNDGRVQ